MSGGYINRDINKWLRWDEEDEEDEEKIHLKKKSKITSKTDEQTKTLNRIYWNIQNMDTTTIFDTLSAIEAVMKELNIPITNNEIVNKRFTSKEWDSILNVLHMNFTSISILLDEIKSDKGVIDTPTQEDISYGDNQHMIINRIDGIEYREGVLSCIFGEDYQLPTPPPGFPRTYTLVCIDLYKIDTNTLYMIMVCIKAAIVHIYKTKKYNIPNNTIINSRFTLIGWNYIMELFDKHYPRISKIIKNETHTEKYTKHCKHKNEIIFGGEQVILVNSRDRLSCYSIPFIL